jgi:hypothetical protein
MGAFAGRFSSAVIVALLPDHPVLVIDEIPNYKYAGDGEIELIGLSIKQWGEKVVSTWRSYAGTTAASAWVDPKTEFTKEMQRCHLRLRKNLGHGPEVQTAVLREYITENRVMFAPWLELLPTELGRARWPDEQVSSYQIRARGQDYTLCALEQVISRRPTASARYDRPVKHWITKRIQDAHLFITKSDSHMGDL